MRYILKTFLPLGYGYKNKNVSRMGNKTPNTPTPTQRYIEGAKKRFIENRKDRRKKNKIIYLVYHDTYKKSQTTGKEYLFNQYEPYCFTNLKNAVEFLNDIPFRYVATARRVKGTLVFGSIMIGQKELKYSTAARNIDLRPSLIHNFYFDGELTRVECRIVPKILNPQPWFKGNEDIKYTDKSYNYNAIRIITRGNDSLYPADQWLKWNEEFRAYRSSHIARCREYRNRFKSRFAKARPFKRTPDYTDTPPLFRESHL